MGAVAVSDEIADLLLDVAVKATTARRWLIHGNPEEAKVAARQAAQLLDRAELLLCKELAVKEEMSV